MLFTREPIIETIITPREGFKLAVRNSKGGSAEEFMVDALEVVSFGSSIFYRFLEKPRAFLFPVSDYEVLEVRETRLIPKTPVVEKTIKIGGGKEVKPAKEIVVAEEMPVVVAPVASGESKRKRNRRGRRGSGANDEHRGQKNHALQEESADQKVPVSEPVVVPTSVFSQLLTPPDTLISESIERMKAAEAAKREAAEKSVKPMVHIEQPPLVRDIIKASMPVEEKRQAAEEEFVNVLHHFTTGEDH